MSRILIIEDEEAIADLEKDYLELSGFEVEIENRGDTGLVRAMKEEFDLIILDLMLPEVDGFDICRQVREEKNTPIIMVSAKKDDIDKIRGLGVGADDYIEKPFSPSVLIAKIKAMLAQYKRLTEKDVVDTNAIQSGDIRLDPKMMKVWIGERDVHLKKKEFQLLEFLMRNKDIVFSKEELYARVWGLESYGDYATVAVHINRLREEVEANPSDCKHIVTVWGVGYKFV